MQIEFLHTHVVLNLLWPQISNVSERITHVETRKVRSFSPENPGNSVHDYL